MKRVTQAERILELCHWMEADYHRELRERSPLSQRDVGETCGVTQSAVARWEAREGRRRPRGRAAIEYHRLLTRLAEVEARREPEAA